MSELTAERLRELLTYNPETGVFVWKHDRCRGKIKAGSVAGSSRGRGYQAIAIDNRLYSSHRLAFLYMTGEFPPDQVDHINRDKSDNRWSNLRPATQSQNQANKPLSKNNRTGLKGACFSRRAGRFVAGISHQGKIKHLGTFDTAEEASLAYQKAARELYGDFASAA